MLKTHEKKVEIHFKSPILWSEYPNNKRQFYGWRDGEITFSCGSVLAKSVGRLLEELPSGTEILSFTISDIDDMKEQKR